MVEQIGDLLWPERVRASLREADRELVLGSIWAFVISAVGLGLGFVTQALLARTLGTVGFGLYAYVLGWANFAAVLSALEFSHAAVRYVSSYVGTHSWGVLHGFIRRSHQLVATTTTSTSLLGVVLVIAFSDRMTTHEAYAFFAACALFPITSLVQLQGASLQGFKRVREAQAPFLVVRPAVFAVGILVAGRWLGSAFEASHAILLQIGATSLTLVITTYLLTRAVRQQTVPATREYRTNEWVRTSFHFVAISIAQLVLSAQADLLLVGTLLGAHEAGLYSAATQLSLLVAFGSSAILVMAQPMIADYYARGELRQLRALARQVSMMGLLLSAPIFAVVVLFGRPLLRLYGQEFAGAYPILLVLATSQLIGAVAGSLLGYLFTMTSHQKVATKIIGASAVLNVLLAIVLTRSMGAIGTAIATAIAMLFRCAVLAIMAQRTVWKEPGASS